MTTDLADKKTETRAWFEALRDRMNDAEAKVFVVGQEFVPTLSELDLLVHAGRIPGTGQLHRIVFNENWEEIRREALFTDWRQRIRNGRQGPDGLIYVLTDETDGALLRLEPAS